MAPVFNSKRAASEWTKLVDDLLAASSSGNSQSTSIDALKQRFGKLEVAINVAPSKLVGNDLRNLAKKVDARLKDVESNTDPKNAAVMRKQLRDEMRSMERGLLQTALKAQTTMGKALLKDSARRQKESQREYAKTTRNQARDIQAILSKQLLEVNERRGTSDSEGLKRLEADLAEGIKALRHDDFKRYKGIADSIKDLKGNYGISDETNDQLKEIEDLVRSTLERKSERRQKIGGAVESVADFVGLGGVVRGVKRVSRGASAIYRGARSVKNATSRGIGAAARAYKACSPGAGLKNSAASALSSLFSRGRSAASDGLDQKAEGSLLRRQVKALEEINSASKKNKRRSSAGVGLKSLFSKGGMLGSLGKLGAKFLGPLIGKLGLLGAAAYGGWQLGSFIYDKFRDEIQDGIEVVVGVVQKGIEFASKGFEWFKEFLDSPLDKIKQIGGKLKDAWDKSVFAKFFSDPGAVISESIMSLEKHLGGLGSRVSLGAKVVSEMSSKALDSVIGVASSAVNMGVDTGKSVAATASSAVTTAQSTVTSGYRSIKDAVGKLFKVAPGVDLDNLNPAVKGNFVSMIEEYKARGGKKPVTINAGFRTFAKQAELHRRDPKRAAPPGRSAHEKGLAIDTNSPEANDLARMGLLSKYGFAQSAPGEAWHLQAKGTASVLASKGIYSADDPSHQGMSSLGVGKGNSTPDVASIAPGSDPVSKGTTGASTTGQLRAPTVGRGSSFQGSVESIPTFSYLDNSFFVMNIGVLQG